MEAGRDGKTILVAEASAFSRGLIRSSLDTAGYRVLEAANLDEAIRGMEQQPTDVVIAALDLPPKGAASLCTAMRGRPELQRIPVLALADSAGQVKSSAAQASGFQDCQDKFDREALLESVARLATAQAAPQVAPALAATELACVAEER